MKKAFFFIDDVIWLFRDLTRKRPASLFDNPFLSMLREAHEKYGLRVQLNVFWRTDFFYTSDEFCLSEMTDKYKSEWEESSDWLKLAFHAKQEFPCYPYVNADYKDVKSDCEKCRAEIIRFAGEKTLANSLVVHFLPMSREGCQALFDCGVKIMDASIGERLPKEADPSDYGCDELTKFRVIHNRKPETTLFRRVQVNGAESIMIAGYNHLSYEAAGNGRNTLEVIKDNATGMYFKDMCNGPCLDRIKKVDIPGIVESIKDYEFVGGATHEQYFYPDYFNYQSDYSEKIHTYAKMMSNAGFEFFFIEELAE